MTTNQNRVLVPYQGFQVLSLLDLILVSLAPIVFTLGCLAVTLTFIVPLVLVLALLIPLAFFLAPIIEVCRSWSGWSWSWLGSTFWCPWLWSWLWLSWLRWPWLCWKWLRP